MLAYTYIEQGHFALLDKPKPVLHDPRDAIVRVTLASICTSDLHIKHGSVPRRGARRNRRPRGWSAWSSRWGSAVRTVKPGDRVTVNVETFCGHCFFCEHGYVNNCTDPEGRAGRSAAASTAARPNMCACPMPIRGLNVIPDSVS